MEKAIKALAKKRKRIFFFCFGRVKCKNIGRIGASRKKSSKTKDVEGIETNDDEIDVTYPSRERGRWYLE